MKQPDLQKAQSETILEEVNEIFQNEKFSDPPVEPVSDSEEVIGEFSSYEKALYTVCHKQGEEAKEILEKSSGFSPIPDMATLENLEKIKSDNEVLRRLMWNSIRKRLGKIALTGSGIGVRQNFKIVVMNKYSVGPISSLGEMMSLMDMTDGDHDHDCENCDSYDICFLPFKKEKPGF